MVVSSIESTFFPTHDLGKKTLVMDSNNGKWAIVPSNLAALGPMVPADLSSEQKGQRDSLVAELKRIGLGAPRNALPQQLSTLILKLTKVCNYRCQYCYDMEPDDKLTHMSEDAALAVLEEAIPMAQAGDPRYVANDLTVILHGGEPTLFFPLIRRLVTFGEQTAARHGKRVHFCGQTNMSRLTGEMVKFFNAHRVQWGVSLDGPPEINDRYRKLPDGRGTYAAFADALERYPGFVRQCGVLTTVTSATEGKLYPIAKHFRDLNMPAWDWSLFQPIGLGREGAKQYAYSVDRVIASWNELFDGVLRGEFDGFQIGPVTKYLSNFITGPGPQMCLREGCGAARELLSVSSDGTIEACDCIDRTGPLGNLGLLQIQTRDSLQRALESEKAKKIRGRNVRLGQCDECIWLAVCGGTCLAHAGTLHGIDHHMCAIAMNAFDRIAKAIAEGDALRRYWKSFYTGTMQ